MQETVSRGQSETGSQKEQTVSLKKVQPPSVKISWDMNMSARRCMQGVGPLHGLRLTGREVEVPVSACPEMRMTEV